MHVLWCPTYLKGSLFSTEIFMFYKSIPYQNDHLHVRSEHNSDYKERLFQIKNEALDYHHLVDSPVFTDV